MIYEDWKKQYSPIKELIVVGSSAKLHEELKTIYEYFIWSVIELDGKEVIIPGKKISKAIRYIICENQHEFEEDLIIKLNMNKSPQEEALENYDKDMEMREEKEKEISPIGRWENKILELIRSKPTQIISSKKDSSLEQVKEFMLLFKQPYTPNWFIPHKKDMVFRSKLDLEELYERNQASGIEGSFALLLIDILRKIYKNNPTINDMALDPLAKYTKNTLDLDTDNVDIVGVLDALADQRYVTDGAIHTYGLGSIFDNAFNEVHSSNLSKTCANIQEAEETIEFHRIEHGECYYIESNGKFLVYRKSDDKAMKSKYYKPANLKQFIK